VRTHRTVLPYQPARHLYPWVDPRPGDPLRLAGIYSDLPMEPKALIEAEFRMEAPRELMIAENLLTPALEIDLQSRGPVIRGKSSGSPRRA